MIATDSISFNVLYRGQLEYLAARGARLTLICGGAPVELNKLRARGVGRVVDVGMVRAPSLRRDVLSLARIVCILWTRRYDVVLITTPKALLLGSIAAWITRQPYRVAFFQGRVYENYTGLRRAVFRLFDRVSLATAHSVLFVSRSLMAAYLHEFPAVGRKGSVIGNGSANGIDTHVFSPDTVSADEAQALRRELGIGDDQYVVMAVGRICHDKGLDDIAAVIDRLAEEQAPVRMVFVGPVDDGEAGATLARLVRDASALHVEFTDDVARFLAIADLHLFLTHREGFGNVAIEAAAMGVPTIAYDVVGVQDSVADGISGRRVRFGNTATVAAHIVGFARDPAAGRAAFAGAREWAVAHFSRETVWSNYAGFFGVDNEASAAATPDEAP